MQHSEWSPSGFKQIMLCPGSKVLQAGAPRTTSSYAAEGTGAHLVLTDRLNDGLPAAASIGAKLEADGFTFEVDDDMARHVQVCIDYANDLVAQGGILLVDRRVHFGSYLGVPDEVAFGTLDVAVILGNELITIDFKYGMGVEVSAGEEGKPNPQLALYGLGILAEVKEIADIERVRLVISQPRTSVKPSEYDLSVEELEAWGYGPARSAVNTCLSAEGYKGNADGAMMDREWEELFLRPGEEQCRFCKTKATCPALRDEVLSVVGISAAGPDEFADIKVPSAEHIKPADPAWLGAIYPKLDMIVDWTKAVLAEIERRNLAGDTVPGTKLVQGKLGNRAWSDKAAAEKMLREQFRLPVEKAYDLSVISPTTAEKLAKAGDIGPRQWKTAEALIVRAPGKPHVAPLSDPRPALVATPVINDFETVEDFS